jgi:hypothetical protein
VFTRGRRGQMRQGGAIEGLRAGGEEPRRRDSPEGMNRSGGPCRRGGDAVEARPGGEAVPEGRSRGGEGALEGRSLADGVGAAGCSGGRPRHRVGDTVEGRPGEEPQRGGRAGGEQPRRRRQGRGMQRRRNWDVGRTGMPRCARSRLCKRITKIKSSPCRHK